MGLANKLPPEIHLMHGTKGRNMGITLPPAIKDRIPYAEWNTDPEQFSKERFVKETADYLFDVYGIGSKQDRHTLAMLADQMEIYVKAMAESKTLPLITDCNNGKTLMTNPHITLANTAMKNAIGLMGELGLTPKSRLTNKKSENMSPLAELMKGVQV